MKTLEDVRQQFPNANYAPRDDCQYCGGTGEKSSHPGMPCICIFVSHDMCDFAATTLAATARKLRMEAEGIAEEDLHDDGEDFRRRIRPDE